MVIDKAQPRKKTNHSPNGPTPGQYTIFLEVYDAQIVVDHHAFCHRLRVKRCPNNQSHLDTHACCSNFDAYPYRSQAIAYNAPTHAGPHVVSRAYLDASSHAVTRTHRLSQN